MFPLLNTLLPGSENATTRKIIAKQILGYLTDSDLLNVMPVQKSWNSNAGEILFVRKKVQHLISSGALLIEADLIDRMIATLLRALNFKSGDSVNIKVMPGSNSPWATVLKIEHNSNAYVLRLIDLHKPIEDVRSEVKIFDILSELRIAPKTLYTNPNTGIILMNFIEAVPGWQRKLEEKDLKALAAQIRIMHNITKFARSSSVAKSGLLVQRRQALSTVLKAYPGFYIQSALLPELDRLDKFINEECFVHQDLHPSNIIKSSDGFWIFDFENSGLGDRALDLALFAAAIRLNSSQEKIFYEAYFGGELDQKQLAKMYLMKIVALIRLSISFFASCAKHEDLVKFNIADIPNFNDYKPSDATIDMASDQGKFYVSTMLAKQAYAFVSSPEYVKAVSILSSEFIKSSLWGNVTKGAMLELPSKVEKSILDFLDADAIKRIGSTSHAWREKSRVVLLSRERTMECEAKINAALLDVDESDRVRVKKAIAAAFTINPSLELTIKPINAGLSPWANLYTLTINGDRYVIRLLDANQKTTSFARELHCMQIYAAMGISPVVENADIANGVVIMRNVNHNPKWQAGISQSVLLDLARLLKKLHSVKLPAEKSVLSINSKFNKLYVKVSEAARTSGRFGYLLQLLDAHKLYEAAIEKIPNAKASLCHGDLNPGNILYDGTQFWAIDWEFAKAGNKLFDIATASVFLRLDENNESFLLACYYGGKISPEQMAEYNIIKQYCYIYYAICSFGLCENFNFELSAEELKQLPPFQMFKPKVSPPFAIDKNTDRGKFMIGIMFAKQALSNMQKEEYTTALRLHGMEIMPLEQFSKLRLDFS